MLNIKTGMANTYDKYYQTENLFGEPYPELIEFFTLYPEKGKILDLGCGQGRNAIALARLGYYVTGIDNSKVGIEQMNQVSLSENLNLVGKVRDIFDIDNFDEFNFILLDSIFHFAKKDKEKEVRLIKNMVANIKVGTHIVVCIQDIGNKVQILKQIIGFQKKYNAIADKKFKYTFEDVESGHKSVTDYRMIVIKK